MPSVSRPIGRNQNFKYVWLGLVVRNTVSATGRVALSLISGNTNTGRLVFGDADAEFRGRIPYTHSAGDTADTPFEDKNRISGATARVTSNRVDIRLE